MAIEFADTGLDKAESFAMKNTQRRFCRWREQGEATDRPDRAPAFLEEKAQALCHLFAASQGREMAAALKNLACGSETDSEPDIRAVEYAFNRLFVGPDRLPAPPCASVYLDAEPRLMGRATAEIRELMQSLGLEPDGVLPEDHLACELELWLILRRLAAGESRSPDSERDEVLRHSAREALAWLLNEHMGRWIPPFLQRARAEAMPRPLAQALDCLEGWLEAAKDSPDHEA